MTVLAGLLAAACVVVGAFHVARLGVRRTDPVGELSYAAMAVGMAAMFSPLGDPVPAPVWITAFVLCGAWFAAVALRPTVSGGADRAHAVHHVVGSGAMLFMLLGAHGGGVADTGAVHAGHVGHGGGPDGGRGLASVVSVVLAGYFAWHVLRCLDRMRVDRMREHPAPVIGAVRVRTAALGTAALGTAVLGTAALGTAVLGTAVLRDARAPAAAHVVMAVAMTVMLLGMV